MRHFLNLRFLLVPAGALVFLKCPVTVHAAETFSVTGSMVTAVVSHTATLMPDGKVLVVGGRAYVGTVDSASRTAQLYNPATGLWNREGNLIGARMDHSAVLLPNGKVLVAGGFGNNVLASAELYDPVTATWTATGSMATARLSHGAVLLTNGKVLVVGGNSGAVNLASAELYDPSTGAWAPAGTMMHARVAHTTTLLADGKVLAASAGSTAGSRGTTELYDPVTSAWTVSGSLFYPRANHTATLLAEGRVLLAGGGRDDLGHAAEVEFYDPATGLCSAAPGMATPRLFHSAILLANGKVLIAGGTNSGGNTAAAELFDPATNRWSPTGSLHTARRSQSATLLANGNVLAAGGLVRFTSGSSATGAAEIYERTLTKLEQWRLTWYGSAANAGNGADHASPHGTGIPNLVVFAFLGSGQDPAVAQPGQLPQPVVSNGAVSYQFSPPVDAKGITYEAEYSSTLSDGSWVPIPDTGTLPARIFRITVNGGSSGFGRLRIRGS